MKRFSFFPQVIFEHYNCLVHLYRIVPWDLTGEKRIYFTVSFYSDGIHRTIFVNASYDSELAGHIFREMEIDIDIYVYA